MAGETNQLTQVENILKLNKNTPIGAPMRKPRPSKFVTNAIAIPSDSGEWISARRASPTVHVAPELTPCINRASNSPVKVVDLENKIVERASAKSPISIGTFLFLYLSDKIPNTGVNIKPDFCPLGFCVDR